MTENQRDNLMRHYADIQMKLSNAGIISLLNDIDTSPVVTYDVQKVPNVASKYGAKPLAEYSIDLLITHSSGRLTTLTLEGKKLVDKTKMQRVAGDGGRVEIREKVIATLTDEQVSLIQSLAW